MKVLYILTDFQCLIVYRQVIFSIIKKKKVAGSKAFIRKACRTVHQIVNFL